VTSNKGCVDQSATDVKIGLQVGICNVITCYCYLTHTRKMICWWIIPSCNV